MDVAKSVLHGKEIHCEQKVIVLLCLGWRSTKDSCLFDI